MRRILTVRSLAVLLFCLLFTQLDPGGAVICIAANGSYSYSRSCSCDAPGRQAGTGCTACVHEDVAVKAEQAGDSLPACCANKSADTQKEHPKKKCCHNFSIDMLAADTLQLQVPGMTGLVDNHTATTFAVLSAGCEIMRYQLDAGLPPPPIERTPPNLVLLRPVRLLL
jgi:hypothetical protein